MAELKVGKPDTTPDAPAHTPGVNQGNATGNYENQDGMLPDGRRTSQTVTGVNAKHAAPIDKRMPCLPPP
ncbi:MAG: hypothetical protein NVSMB25_08360 [Thermoleophilaceae bacterium]